MEMERSSSDKLIKALQECHVSFEKMEAVDINKNRILGELSV